MQSTSALYKSILASPNHLYLLGLKVADSFTYGPETIVEMKVSQKVIGSEGSYGFPSVGNCISAQLDLTMRRVSDIFPKMAKLEPFVNITDGSRTSSDNLKQGVFYIDTRKYDTGSDTVEETDTLSISAFDAMLKTELAYYTKEGDQGFWPRTDIAVVLDIAERIGVELDTATESLISHGYEVQYPGFGEDGYTLREVLGYVGAMYAGNWIISNEGKLKLIPLNQTRSVDQVIDKYEDIDISSSYSPYTRVNIYVSSEYQVTSPAMGSNWSDWAPNTAYAVGDGVEYNSEYYICIVAHTSVSSFTEQYWKKEIIFEMDCPWGTQAMCDNIYSQLNGYSYKGVNITNAILDPALEVGDKIQVSDNTVYIFNRELDYDYLVTADLETPIKSEIDHEYSFKDSANGSLLRSINGIKTSLTVQQGKIEGLIEGQIRTYSGPEPPVGIDWHTGDLFYATSDEYGYTPKIWYRYDGESWVETTAKVDVAPPWVANTPYMVGDVVEYDGKWYNCKTDHTSGETFDPTKWTQTDHITSLSKTQILQLLDSITLSVTRDSAGSSINLTADGIDLKTTGGMLFDTDSAHFTGMLSAKKIVAMGDNFAVQNEEGTITYGYIGWGTGEAGGAPTQGVVMKAAKLVNGVYVPDDEHYFIVTNAGSRMQSGDYSIYVTNNGWYTQREGLDPVMIGRTVFS